VRQSAEVENQMTSVERIFEYAKLDSEVVVRDPPKGFDGGAWPKEGAITFTDVHLRYFADMPYVLCGIDCTIKAREKIGIVGRTGAGKSSLIAALFRLSKTTGTIVIDGVDTATLPLETLRSSISVIPQEPVLFSGTIRRNLDPLNLHADDKIWMALEAVELKDYVQSATDGIGLESTVQEGGGNFSVGQRQLLCLARAVLTHNKILVLDEATANVDNQTDQLIQKTIRTKFSGWTVLTIAHRLNTIIDSDRILVVDQGQVVQFDTPDNLMQTGGHFKDLYEQSLH